MRLITFSRNGLARIGVLDGDRVQDVSAADPGLAAVQMLDVIDGGSGMLERLARVAPRAPSLKLTAVEILAPIPRPRRNIFCVGKNYREHAREFHRSGFDASAGASELPDVPIVFSKAPSTVIGPGKEIPGSLDPTGSVDYENELAVVIGKAGRGIAAEMAFDHVFGYTIINDVTSRTLQKLHRQWFIGKNLDGFCPMGPLILTRDEIADVADIRLTTRVNGEIRQQASVADLIFDIPTLIATLSAGMTLEAGDIIATGTPPGVGIGFTPPKFLSRGDVVSLTIEPIGELRNVVG